MTMRRSQSKTERGGGESRASPRQPWEQQPTETARAYQGFLAYRDVGPDRSIAETARQLGKSAPLLYRWSRQHRWAERSYAWDLECRRAEETALQEARQQALQRQAQDADRLQRLAMAKLGRLVRRDPDSGELALDPEVSVQDAVRIYKLGLDIERSLVATDAADPQGEEQDDELKRMSDEELRQLIELARGRADQHQERGGEDGDN